eukprot:3037698-Prymnesium_polylepis.1
MSYEHARWRAAAARTGTDRHGTSTDGHARAGQSAQNRQKARSKSSTANCFTPTTSPNESGFRSTGGWGMNGAPNRDHHIPLYPKRALQ